MKRQYVLWGATFFLCLLVAVGWAVTHPGFAIYQLQDYVAQKTGRTLLVKGGATLEFFPQLAVRLNDVAISNPDGMEGEFAQADDASLPVRFSDILRRKLKIENITLTNPHINLLIDTRGQGNWIFAESNAAGSAGKSDKTPSSKKPLKLYLENGSINYRDERNDQAFAIANAAVAVDVGEDDELDISGTAAINAQFSEIAAHIKSLRRVAEDGSPADITLKAPALELSFSGRLGTRKALGLVGSLDASTPDLRLLAKWIGSEIPGSKGLKKFAVAGAIDSTGSAFKLVKATLRLDDMTATGDLAADFSKKTPQVSAALATDLLTLDPYLGSMETGTAKTDMPSPDWDSKPLSFSGLKGIDGTLALSASAVKWQAAKIGPVKVSSSLKDGRLETDLGDGTLYGGTGTAKIVLDGSQATPALQLDFDGHGLDGEKFLHDIAGLDWLGGKTALKISLIASGGSQREMMSTLGGTFNIEVLDGEIKHLDIMKLVSQVSSAVISGWGQAPESPSTFTRAGASFTIADGIAKSVDVEMKSPLLQVTGSGEVDMLRQVLDFKFDPQLVTGEDRTSSLPVQVAVKGPWNNPKIYPDVAGILDNPDAAYDALRQLGLPEKTLNKIEKKGKKFLKKLIGN